MLCKFGDDQTMSKDVCTSCGRDHPWHKWIGTDNIEGRKCFDCCAAGSAAAQDGVHPLQVAVYYKQLTDWSRATPSSFAMAPSWPPPPSRRRPLSKLYRACAPSARERHKCKACKSGGDGLLACSFLTTVYHNAEACLGEAQEDEALAKSASFPWACPACLKKGIAAVQRATLKPTGQRAAGAKKKRKRRK